MTPFDQAQQSLRTAQAPPVQSQFPDIANLFQAGQQARLGSALAGVASKTANSDLQYKSDTADYNRRAAISSLQAKKDELQAKASGEGYTRSLNASGGFTFTDPNGQPVSAYAYAKAKGQPIPTVLSGSLDPKQKSFADDYQGTVEIGNTVVKYAGLPASEKTAKKVKEAQAKFAKDDSGNTLSDNEKILVKYATYAKDNSEFINKKPQDIMLNLINTYPDIYKSGEFQSPIQGEAGGALPEKQPNAFQNLLSSLRGR